MKRVNFSKDEDDFLKKHIDECYTLHDLVEIFNEKFPRHKTNYENLQKRLSKIGLRKGTHHIRKGKIIGNPYGTVIVNKDGSRPRVKTGKGYVAAGPYFREKYFGENGNDKKLVHLNGNKQDFSRENIVLVTKSIFSSLCWRGWFFKEPELTKTAILTAQLLSFFPDLVHNENQYYKMMRGDGE